MAVNYLAVLLAAVASFVLGWVWYGPLFGKTWVKLSGKEMGDKDKMPMAMGLTFVAALVTAYVLAALLGLTGSKDLVGAFTIAFWVWLGFQATLLLGGVLWGKQSWNLYFLNVTHKLLDLLVIAAVLSYIK